MTDAQLEMARLTAINAELVAAIETTLGDLRPNENGFPRNAHCARSRLREALVKAREHKK